MVGLSKKTLEFTFVVVKLVWIFLYSYYYFFADSLCTICPFMNYANQRWDTLELIKTTPEFSADMSLCITVVSAFIDFPRDLCSIYIFSLSLVVCSVCAADLVLDPKKTTQNRGIWKLFEKFSSIRQRKKFMLLFLGSVVCFYFIFRFYKFSLTCNRVQKKQQQQSAIRREWKRMMRRKATKKTKHNSEKRIYDETATAARKGRNKGDNDARRRHRWCDIKA